jgi:hypothetical protein
MEKNPDALKEFKLDMGQRRALLNYVNGKRPLAVIRSYVMAETDRDLDFASLVKYLEFLKAVGWIIY